MSTFNLTSPIYIVNPTANVDSRYGPWSSVTDANNNINQNVRRIGLTVGVSSVATGVVEYWYKNGIQNTDLIIKNTEGGTGGTALSSVINYLSTNNVFISSLNVFDRFVVNNQLYYSTDNKTSQLSALSGNYDEGQFLGDVKLTQNNTRLVDIGETWVIANELNIGWQDIAMSSDGKYQTAVEGTEASIAESGSIYISNNYGKTWQRITNDPYPNNSISVDMSSDGKYQVVGRAGNVNGFCKFSDDYGNTWKSIGPSFTGFRFVSISGDGKYITIGGKNTSGIHVAALISDDFGKTFTELEAVGEVTLSLDGKYQIALRNNTRIQVSQDYGKTWAFVGPNVSSAQWESAAISSDGKYQTVVRFGGPIYISSDYGNTWISRLTPKSWRSVAMSSDGKYQTIVVVSGFASDKRIYVSQDYGHTWTPKSTEKIWTAVAMSSDGKYQTATTGDQGIYISVAGELIDGNLTVANNISAKDVIYGRLGSLDTQLNTTSTNGVQNSAIAIRIQNIENSLNLVSPPPTYNNPEATLNNFSPNIIEVGETINQTLNLGWIQRDAGSITNPFFVLTRNGFLAAQNSVPFNFSVNEVTTLGTVTFRNTVTFSDGPIKNNILGLPDSRGRILSGSVWTERSYNGRYKTFFGSVISIPTNLRTLTGVNWDTENSFSFFAYNTANILVIPFNKQLISITTSNFETITNNFTLSTTTVPNGGGVPVSYKRYVQTTALPFDLRLDVVLSNV